MCRTTVSTGHRALPVPVPVLVHLYWYWYWYWQAVLYLVLTIVLPVLTGTSTTVTGMVLVGPMMAVGPRALQLVGLGTSPTTGTGTFNTYQIKLVPVPDSSRTY